MGTNFYLFTKNKKMASKHAPYSYQLTDEPELGYAIHIAKTSYGWLPLFQAHKNGIDSVEEYKEAYDTNEYKMKILNFTTQHFLNTSQFHIKILNSILIMGMIMIQIKTDMSFVGVNLAKEGSRHYETRYVSS